MRAKTRTIAIAVAAALAVAGCSTPNTNTYNVQDVGRVIDTSGGTVVTSRIVDVSGGDENSGAGAVAGGVAGASVGGLTVGSGNGSVLAAVIGGLIGAGAGYLAEDSIRSREGIEYVIRTDDGQIVTVVQNRDNEEEPLPADSRVLLQYGADYTRVVELPSELRPAAGGGGQDWQNPDLEPDPLAIPPKPLDESGQQ